MPLVSSPFSFDRITVLDVLGPAGPGTSNPVRATAAEGGEWILKGVSLTPERPYVAACELLGHEVSRRLGIPALDVAVAEYGADLFFACRRVPAGRWSPRASTGAVRIAENPEALYQLAVLDSWLLNGDRHEGNLLLTREPGAPTSRRVITAFDFSQAPLDLDPRPAHPADLADLVDAPVSRYVQLQMIRDAIDTSAQLSAALTTVEDMLTDDISGILRAIPDQMLEPLEREQMLEFLIKRRARLRGLFVAERDIFPRMDRGAL